LNRGERRGFAKIAENGKSSRIADRIGDPREIPRPAGESAGLRNDAPDADGLKSGPFQSQT
jgi:hypothetical protein